MIKKHRLETYWELDMTKIKLCGNFRVEDAELLNVAKPDMAGMIFAPNHRRTVNIGTAIKIRDRLDDSIPLVGVFMDQPVADIMTIYQSGMVQVVQLHGSETEFDVEILQENNIPVIQVHQPDNFLKPTAADYVLLDAGAGSGQTFDWGMVPPKPLRQQPLMLAGGLTVNNLQQSINKVHPDFVDISSGDEVDGIKNIEKMQALVAIAHANLE